MSAVAALDSCGATEAATTPSAGCHPGNAATPCALSVHHVQESAQTRCMTADAVAHLSSLAAPSMPFRSAGTGMAPGIDLLAPLPPGSVAFLLMSESAIIHRACFPAPLTKLNIESMPRPPGFPGQQQAIPLAGTPAEQQRQQEGGCSGRGAEYDSNLVTPPLRLCWEAYGTIPDVVTYSAAIDPVLGRPKPDGYLV